METLLRDLAYAWRTLTKTPAFTLTSAVTIALGIGACTAVFSVVNGVLLRPLPYADPDRLVLVWSELRTRNVNDFPFSIPDVRDLRDSATTFEGFAGVTAPGRTAVSGDSGEPEQIRSAGATTNLFHVLGVRMALGRAFTDADGAPQPPPRTSPSASNAESLLTMTIISDRLWQRRYGSDPSVVGRTIGFGNGRAQIVGVLPPDFELLFPPRTGIAPDVDVWTAMRLNYDTAARNTAVLRVIGRLKPAATLVHAQSDLDDIAASLREQHPAKKNVDLHFRVVGMHADLVRDVRVMVLALFGAVAFVLLIACANVANLLLVRALGRQREFVIRSAIGAGRAHLVRQMLTETLIVAGLGGAFGVGLAFAGVELLASMAPPRLPRVDAIHVDATVLAFSLGVTVLTALVCGCVPALRASRQNVAEIVRASAPELREARTLRHAAVIAEVALSFALLAASGLMIRSVVALQRVDPGYDASGLLTFFRPASGDPDARAAFVKAVTERLEAVPGVISAAAATPLPLSGGLANIPWAPEAGAANPAAFRQATLHFVTPGYFETMRTRLIAGRTFTNDDNTPKRAHTVVIDELLAAQAYPGESPIGRQLLMRNLNTGPNEPLNVNMEIIGVVAHQRHESLTSTGREALFILHSLAGYNASRWVVRTAGKPSALTPAIVAAVAAVDPRVPVAEVQPMTSFVERANGPTRFAATMIGLFAGIAMLLAAVGLYGVIASTVRQRTAEIGIRMVCGAQPRAILGNVLTEGLRLSGIGMALGLVLALLLAEVIRSMLVSTSPTDPRTFATISAVFLVVSVLATLIPAIRAARVDPIIAIRRS
jgi:predicted permease